MAFLKVADHVGHKWAKDSRGIYCKCEPGHAVRLYAIGSPSNSEKRQRAIATALDAIRDYVASQQGPYDVTVRVRS